VTDLAARYRQAGWWPGERLVDRVATNVESSPDSVALVAGSVQLSLSELWNLAGERADHLAAEIGPTRRVVLIDLPNDASWLVTFLAVLRGGHVPATAPVTATAQHLAHVIDLIDPAMAITCTPGVHAGACDAVQEGVGFAAASAGVALIEGAEMKVLTGPGQSRNDSDSLGSTDHLMLTSSTTGLPKAVSHTEDSLGTLNRQFAERFELDHTTPILMPSPLGHSVGAIHGARLALHLGAPLVVQDQWDPQVALRLADEHHAAFTAAATPFLLDLANAAPLGSSPKFETVRSFLCGGAQVPPGLLRRCREELPNTFVTPLWGMTEGGLTTCVRESPVERIDNSVGIPLPDLEVRAIDPDGVAHPVGEGELAMRGPGVFNGYHGQVELYAESLTSDGFFRTGDLAKISSDGYVEITGRIKDLIIRGAVNISPVDTENVIAAHRDVRGVAVIGWPDERLGERLCAVIDATTALTLDDVLDFCREGELPKRYWPERLELVDEFPRTAAGKIRKQQLRDELLARAAKMGDVVPEGGS
jgi:cyclohexanecarboxylate-CoA ligase